MPQARIKQSTARQLLKLVRFFGDRFDEGAYQVYSSALYGDDDTTIAEAVAQTLTELND